MEVRTIRRILMVVLLVIFLGSAGYVVRTLLDYRHDRDLYAVAQNSFVSPATPAPVTLAPEMPPPLQEDPGTEPSPEMEETPPPEQLEISVDFAALQGVNPDVLGWFWIPDTEISYPLLQGESNQSYIHTAYTGEYATAGSIFMDYRCRGDFSDPNTIIYGHNMKNGTMFGSLKQYREAEYAAEHPFFYVLLPEGYRKYAVCYALVTDALGNVYDYRFTKDRAFSAHLDMLKSLSLYETGEEIASEDAIVTLSTCTGNARTERFVVIGKLIGNTTGK